MGIKKGIEKYFAEQLKVCGEISSDKLAELKGKGLYSDYSVGDKVLAFLEQETIDIESSKEAAVNMTLKMVTHRELEKMSNNYNFVGMANILPIFERK